MGSCKLLAILTVLTLSVSLNARHGPPRRNVLFLLEDDGGFAMGPYGDKVIATPNLDALAGE
jgi:hypothetical protein